MRTWALGLPLAARLQLRRQQWAAASTRALLQPAAATADDGFFTLAGSGTGEVVESKSRFVAIAAQLQTLWPLLTAAETPPPATTAGPT